MRRIENDSTKYARFAPNYEKKLERQYWKILLGRKTSQWDCKHLFHYEFNTV